MKKQITAIAIMAAMLPGAYAQTVLTNLTMYWNADTPTPTTTNSSVGAFGNYVSGSPTFSQFNNFGNTTMITTTSASIFANGNAAYTGASGTNNFGLAVRAGNFSNASAFEFSITLTNSAQWLRITDFDFGTRSTGTGPQAFSLQASYFSNFNSPITIFNGSLANNSNWVFTNGSFGETNLNAGNQVFFRLYGFNGAGSPASGTANWRIDDITLTASVIPEPSTYALIGLALLGVFFFARRRKAALNA